MFFKKKKMKTVNILKLMNLSQDDSDRILGGMVRLENMYKSGPDFVKNSLKLAKNQNETSLIWYILGIKIGILTEMGLVIPQHIGKKITDNVKEKRDPMVQ